VRLACDRIGLRDLYYTTHEDVLYFSTVIRAFRQIPGWDTGTDNRRVCEYMAYRRVAGRHTMYANVDRVLPGECVSVPFASSVSFCSSFSCDRYWTYHWEPDDRMTLETASRRLHELLRNRLAAIRSDKDLSPVIMLSGGVDSAGLLAEANQIGWDIPAMTLVPDDAAYSELGAVKRICERLGVDWCQVPVDADTLAANLDEGHMVLEQPVVHTIALLHMEIYRRAAAAGHNAFICGEAADTLFGYDRFAKYQQVWSHSSHLIDPLVRLIARISHHSKFVLWGELTSPKWRAFVCRGRAHFDDAFLAGIMSSWEPCHDERMTIIQSTEGSPLAAASRYYFETFIQDCRIFIALGRAAGLEPILPYTSAAVRDFALALPAMLKFNRGRGKLLLKHAMDELLPDGTAWARKRSGEQPLGRWLREHQRLESRVAGAVRDSQSYRFFNLESTSRLQKEHMSGMDHSVLLWQMLSLDIWMRGCLA